jgi:hypothetical protein
VGPYLPRADPALYRTLTQPSAQRWHWGAHLARFPAGQTLEVRAMRPGAARGHCLHVKLTSRGQVEVPAEQHGWTL